VHEIANALGVANVLEGSVRRDGNHVRVSTELVDARSYNAIWAESYDRDLTDIFAIQSEIAQTVASKLKCPLVSERTKRHHRSSHVRYGSLLPLFASEGVSGKRVTVSVHANPAFDWI
jgi:hypothetical protein